MTGSINPAVRRVGYGRFGAQVGVFAVGVFIGGAFTFAVTGLLTSALAAVAGRPVAVGAVLAVVILVSLRDLSTRIPVPYRNVQVPEWIKHAFSPAATAFLYGTHLGVGLLTRFTLGAHTAFVLALPFLGSAPHVVGVLALFALGKCVVIVAAAAGPDYDRMERRLAYRLRWRPLGSAVLRGTSIVASAAVVFSLFADL